MRRMRNGQMVTALPSASVKKARSSKKKTCERQLVKNYRQLLGKVESKGQRMIIFEGIIFAFRDAQSQKTRSKTKGVKNQRFNSNKEFREAVHIALKHRGLYPGYDFAMGSISRASGSLIKLGVLK